PPRDVCGYPSTRKVMVTNANTLRTALAAATAGDMIQFAAGSYVGKFDLTASGTKAQPIVLCGPRTAIIDAGGGGYGLHLDGASFVIVSGISITNGLKNVMLDKANDNLLSNIYVANSKQEGVHFRMGSSRNVIVSSEIRDTGTAQAEFGEGLYIGSSGGNDEAHDNKAVNNKFSNNGAECIDIKEGTRGGLIYGNTMDGGGLKGENFADSLIDVKGNNYVIEKNEGGNALLHAFEVHSINGRADSGHDNVFRDNVLSVKNPMGLGIWLDVKAMGNVVSCSNKVTGGMGFSTAMCTP
ncbi:MAG TPA: right-handed parallel beta-helix repeat-containing protein, partial [Polyangia bacterium]